MKTKDFSPKSNPEQDPFVPGSKPGQPIENIACSGCSGFEEGFSGGEKKDRTDSVEGAPDGRAADQPDDTPTDRTCVQCNGAIDGKERLVAVSGKAVWLHPECERFWLAALDEGRCPERVPADPAASSRSFRIKGPAPPDSVCVCCYRDEAEAVLKIASTEAGSKSETLHEKCAAQWFAALRDFENGPSDDDNSWQGQA